jgi:hypothetical protein
LRELGGLMHHFSVVFASWAGLVAAIAWPMAGWADERQRVAREPLGAEAPSLLDRLLGSPEAAQPANAAQADCGSGREVSPALPLAPPPLAAEVEAAATQVREAFGGDLQEIGYPVRRRELFDKLVEATAVLAVAPSQCWATCDLTLEIASQACEADSVREALDKRAILFTEQDRLGPMLAFLKDV